MCIMCACMLSVAPQTLVALILPGQSSLRHCVCRAASGRELAYCLCAVEAVRRGKGSTKQSGNALRQLADTNKFFFTVYKRKMEMLLLPQNGLVVVFGSKNIRM